MVTQVYLSTQFKKLFIQTFTQDICLTSQKHVLTEQKFCIMRKILFIADTINSLATKQTQKPWNKYLVCLSELCVYNLVYNRCLKSALFTLALGLIPPADFWYSDVSAYKTGRFDCHSTMLVHSILVVLKLYCNCIHFKP